MVWILFVFLIGEIGFYLLGEQNVHTCTGPRCTTKMTTAYLSTDWHVTQLTNGQMSFWNCSAATFSSPNRKKSYLSDKKKT